MNRCSRWQLVTGGSSISYQWSTMPPWLRCTSLADAVLNYNYSMKAVDLGDKILKSYEMNRKTLLWTTKLVFYLANMAMMNGYLLMCRSQQAVREGIIMQGHVQNLPHLREDLKLHNHFTFRVNVILALVEEGNRDHSFHNPYVRVLAVAPEWRFNECHFPEEIIPTKERAKNYHRCNGCYTEKGGGGKYTKFQCGLCKKFLCPWPCFEVYHTKGLMHVDAIKAQNDQLAGKVGKATCMEDAVLGGDLDLPQLNETVWLLDYSLVLFAQVEPKEWAFRSPSQFTIACDNLGTLRMTISIVSCIKAVPELYWSVRINVWNMLDVHVLSASARWHGLWIAHNPQKFPPTIDDWKTATVTPMCMACGPHFEGTQIRDIGRLCHTVASEMLFRGYDTDGCSVHALNR